MSTFGMSIRVIFILAILCSCYIVQNEGKSVLSLSWIRQSGQFSWFYPKIEISDNSIDTEEVERPRPIDEETQRSTKIEELLNKKSFKLHEEILFDGIKRVDNLRTAIQKGFSSFHHWKGNKYHILLTNDHTLIISYKSWPVGWRHYPFKVVISEKEADSEGESTTFIIDLHTTNSHRNLQDFMLRLEITPSADGESGLTLVGTVFHNSKVSKRLTRSLFEPAIYHIKKLLTEYVKLYERRKVQHDEYSKTSQSVEEKRKKQERDKIIHPEKYKSKSPTVRNVGGRNGGTGRYTPSADVRARREVKRGG